MRPTGVEPATFGLKDRRSLGPRKDPLTTELRALKGERYPQRILSVLGGDRLAGWIWVSRAGSLW